MLEIVMKGPEPVKVITLRELLPYDYRFFAAFRDKAKYILVRHLKGRNVLGFYWQSVIDVEMPTLTSNPCGGRSDALEYMLSKGYRVVCFDTYTEMMEWLLNNK